MLDIIGNIAFWAGVVLVFAKVSFWVLDRVAKSIASKRR